MMTSQPRIVCVFCNTPNPPGRETCLACGGPLPSPGARSVPPAFPVEEPAIPQAHPTHDDTVQGAARLRETGEQVEVIGRKALYAYALLWRTLAEAAAIILTAFALGLVGGITGTAGLAVPGAVLVGAGVGLAVKRPLLALFSAPAGMLLGALAGGVLALLGAGPWVLVGCAVLGAFLAALLGGNPRRGAENVYEKLRPFIGTAGALVFGLLGMLLGLALRAAGQALLK